MCRLVDTALTRPPLPPLLRVALGIREQLTAGLDAVNEIVTSHSDGPSESTLASGSMHNVVGRTRCAQRHGQSLTGEAARSRCPTCSTIYRRDAYALVRTGLAGDEARGVSGNVAGHPRVFNPDCTFLGSGASPGWF